MNSYYLEIAKHKDYIDKTHTLPILLNQYRFIYIFPICNYLYTSDGKDYLTWNRKPQNEPTNNIIIFMARNIDLIEISIGHCVVKFNEWFL